MSSSEQPVKDQLDESLSALVDGEATELEVRRLLKSIDSEPEVRDQWHRYQLASAAMRDDVKVAKPIDLSAAISAAIEEEPTYSAAAAKPAAKKSRLWSNLGRMGIAASVAGAVVLGVQFSSTESGSNLVVETPAPFSGKPNFGNNTVSVVSAEETPTISINSERQPIAITEETQQQLRQVEEELGRLMLEHAQDASQNTQHGVLPYVRVPEAE